jgi:hypothetical protein
MTSRTPEKKFPSWLIIPVKFSWLVGQYLQILIYWNIIYFLFYIQDYSYFKLERSQKSSSRYCSW